jgi:hypothetical protein
MLVCSHHYDEILINPKLVFRVNHGIIYLIKRKNLNFHFVYGAKRTGKSLKKGRFKTAFK